MISKAPKANTAKKTKRRRRATRPYPSSPFEEVIVLAETLFKTGSGLPVRRLTVFDELGKSPDSSASRDLVTNSNKYGLTKGGYTAEQLELTDIGRRIVDPEYKPREQARAKIEAAIKSIEIFNVLYESVEGKKLPTRSFLVDACKGNGISEEHVEEAVDTFILNLRSVGLLKALSGAERVVPVDMALDDLPSGSHIPSTISELPSDSIEHPSNSLITADRASFETTCFMITPIGDPDSEERKHSDLIIGSFIEPALDEFGLSVVRADKIDKPGVITRQIIDYLVNSRIVVADLSFSNPNVFYELAIRHALRKPIVQIIREGDRIPFDVNQMRTIKIDLTNVYSAIPKIELIKTDIRNQVRRALENPDQVDTPITLFYPDLRVEMLGNHQT